MSNTLTSKVSGRMSSRGWAIALGIGAVALAAILLVVYLDRYRARVGGENAPTPVLEAKQLIPAGTPGTLVASQSMYASTTLPQKEVVVGAIADPAYLSGRAAATDIFPGAQLTANSLRRERHRLRRLTDHGHRSARSRSRSTASTGQLSQVHAGRLGRRLHRPSQATVKLFRPNVKVLTTPTIPGPAGGGNLVLRIETADAATWAYAADNTQF